MRDVQVSNPKATSFGRLERPRHSQGNSWQWLLNFNSTIL